MDVERIGAAMKVPTPPPDVDRLALHAVDGRTLFDALMATRRLSLRDDYLPWDRLRHRQPPEGLTAELWWMGIKLARRTSRRELALLRDVDGVTFSYNLPDQLLRQIDEINRGASGLIAISEEVTNPATRDRYIISSLIEESITSSQLEGAATTRNVAKDMLRSGRQPRDHSERMIVNNYRAMRRIVELQNEPLTPERVCEIHRIVTDGTLRDRENAGRVQSEQSERTAVYDATRNRILHQPPPVDELDDRLRLLCDFANGNAESDDAYLPPVLRAIAVHFMVGYDHYFEDGNGRTARALFYWCMLRQGYWLTEFLTISALLKAARAQYGRSFLLTEQDEGDLTHFFLYHCSIVARAIDALHVYLSRKAAEVRSFQTRMSSRMGEFNHRQVAVLEHSVKNPGTTFSARSHATAHNVTTQTARLDLSDLERRGLLAKTTVGRRQIWSATAEVSDMTN